MMYIDLGKSYVLFLKRVFAVSTAVQVSHSAEARSREASPASAPLQHTDIFASNNTLYLTRASAEPIGQKGRDALTRHHRRCSLRCNTHARPDIINQVIKSRRRRCDVTANSYSPPYLEFCYSASPVYRAGLGCNTALSRALELHLEVFLRPVAVRRALSPPRSPGLASFSAAVTINAIRDSLACNIARPNGHAIVTTHIIGGLPKRPRGAQ
jgi:hypothetical protein